MERKWRLLISFVLRFLLNRNEGCDFLLAFEFGFLEYILVYHSSIEVVNKYTLMSLH